MHSENWQILILLRKLGLGFLLYFFIRLTMVAVLYKADHKIWFGWLPNNTYYFRFFTYLLMAQRMIAVVGSIDLVAVFDTFDQKTTVSFGMQVYITNYPKKSKPVVILSRHSLDIWRWCRADDWEGGKWWRVMMDAQSFVIKLFWVKL